MRLKKVKDTSEMPCTEQKIRRLLIYLMALILVTGILTNAAAGSREEPSWLEQVRDEAKQDGYKLISAPELKALYDTGKDLAIIDVRPGYEYRDGHLPHAKSLEFDLGDKLELKPEKQAALIELIGPDKQRMVVFYCRSFA
jgi:phage shock protein E